MFPSSRRLEAGDQSLFSPRQVRAYLGMLQVPLHVWSLSASGSDREWGEARVVGSPRDLQAAAEEVRRDFDDQRVVWIRGRHLPQAIHLAVSGAGLELAGGSEP